MADRVGSCDSFIAAVRACAARWLVASRQSISCCCHLEHGQSEEAENEYKTALAIAPEDIELKIGLARAYYQQGKDYAGVAIIEDILKDGTKNSTILALYIRLLMRSGQHDLAIETFQQATTDDR